MPDWNLAQLRTEFLNRGFHFVVNDGPSRPNEFILKAVEEIHNEEPWPFRYVETEITTPNDVSNYPTIARVEFEGRALKPADYHDLRDQYGATWEGQGAPQSYYQMGNQIGVYPAIAEDAVVRVGYYAVECWSGTGDQSSAVETPETDSYYPVIPPRFRDLIVLLATADGQADSEDYEDEMASRQKYEQRLDQMKRELIRPNDDEFMRIRIVSGVDWA